MHQSDFTVFRDRIAEACHLRNMPQAKLYARVGLGGRRAVDFELSGVSAIDINRLALIAEQLDVSLDWLLGRTNVMSVLEMPEPEPPKRKAKKPA